MNSEKVNERFQSHLIYGPRLIQIIVNYVNHELPMNLFDKSLSGESLENLSKFFAASFFQVFSEYQCSYASQWPIWSMYS